MTIRIYIWILLRYLLHLLLVLISPLRPTTLTLITDAGSSRWTEVVLGVLLGDLEDIRAADPKAEVQLSLQMEVCNISAQNSKRWLIPSVTCEDQ